MVQETLTNREFQWTGLTYDDLCKMVNDAYRENPDIRMRTLAHDLGIPFDVVWECLRFREIGPILWRQVKSEWTF